MLAAHAEKKGIRLYNLIEPGVPLVLQGDPMRLRQMLTNLLSNALKFTAAGEVPVHVKARPPRGSQGRLIHCEVRDSGIGVAAEIQERLFQPFHQADGSTTRHFGGTGLGLSISRRFIEMMGGSIGMRSRPGHGSTFWFEVPLAEGNYSPVDYRASIAGRRVLIVDDQPMDRSILRRQLEPYDLLVDEAAGPSEALTLLRRGLQQGRPYHFALIDYRMPEMDGIELGRRILADSAGRPCACYWSQPWWIESSGGKQLRQDSAAISRNR